MRIYKPGFIGHNQPNFVTEWPGEDNFAQFTENVSKMGESWYYNKNKITYSYNSFGHRSKNLKDLDLDNYILFTGCSHTEGVGVEYEKRYSHVLSDRLNCDYYNLAMSATGIDTIIHNLTIWFSTVPKKPKALIIQWPDFTRLMTGANTTNLRPRGSWTQEEDYLRFISLGIDLEFFEAKKIMAHYVAQSFNVPTIYFGLEKVIPFDDTTIIKKILDKGRDLSHPGILSHASFANAIYEHMINTRCLNFYQNTKLKK